MILLFRINNYCKYYVVSTYFMRVRCSPLCLLCVSLCQGEQIHPQAPNPLSCQQQQVPATVSSNTGRNEIISNPKTHLIIPKVINAFGGRWLTLN